jgi:hypothetical protein
MYAKSHESINGHYEYKQATNIYNNTFLIPATFCTMKENGANFFPGLFRFYFTVPWYSIFGTFHYASAVQDLTELNTCLGMHDMMII